MTCSNALRVGCLALLAAGSASATTITLDTDFEAPTFAIGDISANPNATGQGGWGGYNSVLVGNGPDLLRARISDQQAHSGTQSLRTTYDTRTINKALDPAQGEYPFAGFFTIPASSDWWIQAWVRIDSGSSGITMTTFNSLGGCPLLQISGTGVPYVNSCLSHDPNQATLGAGAFDQWLLLEMVHTAPSAELQFNITGPGISRSITLPNYSGPGSGPLQYLGLAGDAYWDDVRAGYGPVPQAVPLPAAGWLLATAFGTLVARRRKRG